MTSLKH